MSKEDVKELLVDIGDVIDAGWFLDVLNNLYKAHLDSDDNHEEDTNKDETNDESIYIYLTDDDVIVYDTDEYTEYDYNGKFFVVKKDERWIGMFNVDSIKCVLVGELCEYEY